MNRVRRYIPKEIMVDMERATSAKSSEKLTGAELRILALLRRWEGKPVTGDMLGDQVDPDFGCGNPAFIFPTYAASRPLPGTPGHRDPERHRLLFSTGFRTIYG